QERQAAISSRRYRERAQRRTPTTNNAQTFLCRLSLHPCLPEQGNTARHNSTIRAAGLGHNIAELGRARRARNARKKGKHPITKTHDRFTSQVEPPEASRNDRHVTPRFTLSVPPRGNTHFGA